MDAVKFVQDYIRLCAQQEDCDTCPIYGIDGVDFCSAMPKERSLEGCEKLVTLVYSWALAHPTKTRQDAFLEHYPNASLSGAGGSIHICPRLVDKNYDGKFCEKLHCAACKITYWKQKVE